MISSCKALGKHYCSELLITMPPSCSVIPLSIYPQALPKIVQKLHTSIQTTHINNAHVKITETAKKGLEETTHNQQEMWCQHPTKWKHRFVSPSVGRTKISSPIDLHSIHLIPIYLTLGPLLVTSAEMHNAVALKEQPESLGPCVVAW